MQLWGVFISSVCNPNPRSIALSISSTFIIPQPPCMATYNLYIIPPYICHVSASYGRVFGTYSGMVKLCRSGRIPTQGPAMAFPHHHARVPAIVITPHCNYHARPCLLTIGTTLPLLIVASLPPPRPLALSAVHWLLVHPVYPVGTMRHRGACKKQMSRAHKAEETMQQQSYSRMGLFLSSWLALPHNHHHYYTFKDSFWLSMYPPSLLPNPPPPLSVRSLSPPCQYRSASPTSATE